MQNLQLIAARYAVILCTVNNQMHSPINTYIKGASPLCFSTSVDGTLVLKYIAEATLVFVLIKTVNLVGVINGVLMYCSLV